MLKIILQDRRYIHPFNERARDLRIQNKPLWLHQRDILAPYIDRVLEVSDLSEIPPSNEACLVYRDNLFFDEHYIRTFIEEAKRRNQPARAAFSPTDPAFREHALPLSTSYSPAGGLYMADLWYFPNGPVPDAEPLIIELQASEVGYYHVPTYMAIEQGDLTFQVPIRALIAIDAWVHIFIAEVVFSLFAQGVRFEQRLNKEVFFKLGILSKAIYEGKQVLESSGLVQIGENCTIDPSAVIHGPTTIGDNVTIGAGAVIDNCVIGNNVNISQGCQLLLSVVGDGAFLPFRAALFMTTIMDNSMVAQNTCLQMCVIGRNTFVGAGSTFTDYNLLPLEIRARDGNNQLVDSKRPVLGGCVGHNCRLGSGIIVSPARTIESDVVIVASNTRRVITKDVNYEDSDHHHLRGAELHPRQYPRPGETDRETW
ncbi:MAG: multidrug transporter [Chloroflexi bacterium]|nr:MAG: multidrug transporter [Chloroflexota bacterium]MBL1197007.1 multidrug transporter [Chloroflexota bacterium]NOH14302.1 multidrug transporter [Chloroflexota bacterium]